MTPITPLMSAAGLVAVFLGLTAGLYRFLTMGQRRRTREIRESAGRLGWRYRRRRWQGNPGAFRIDGQTDGGLTWVLTCGNGSDSARGWSTLLALRFPTLGGDPDFAILPRDAGGTFGPRGQPSQRESNPASRLGAALPRAAPPFCGMGASTLAASRLSTPRTRCWAGPGRRRRHRSTRGSPPASCNGPRTPSRRMRCWPGGTCLASTFRFACRGRQTGRRWPTPPHWVRT